MATSASQTLRTTPFLKTPSLLLSSKQSLSSAFSVALRPSRRFSKPLVVIVKASGSLDTKSTVLVAKKLGKAGLKLLKEFANVDFSYNLSPEELCTKISLCDFNPELSSS